MNISPIRLLSAALLFVGSAAAFCAEEHMGLVDQEQLDLQRNLAYSTALMWSLVVVLILFALTIRYIARRTTHPCHWCMEFISNAATTCPRCGKSAARE